MKGFCKLGFHRWKRVIRYTNRQAWRDGETQFIRQAAWHADQVEKCPDCGARRINPNLPYHMRTV